jgi:isopentenyl phosphate kinase
MSQTIFLKLGGSLITDKDQANTPLIHQIDLIASQIRLFVNKFPDSELVIGHGSGSFGHSAASLYHTRAGVNTPEEWGGFTKVWAAARNLNQIVVDRFSLAGLPAISFPLSSSAVTHQGEPSDWNTRPILLALQRNLLPIIYGDVVLDDIIGGTILSTEEQFAALVPLLKPERILLAGREEGVWQDFPACTTLISDITPLTYPSIEKNIFGSASVDVTGGMAAKVRSMVTLVQNNPGLRAQIFSGKAEDAIFQALTGKPLGSILHSDCSGGTNEIWS